ncbi:hypothetical protein [Bhargavaea ullalensis]|uniref:Uncharacterized protein n=1 Tax=Bhargavaea ullalensis TaxID=1265685 RepID=A0ABV2GEC2_9BACL
MRLDYTDRMAQGFRSAHGFGYEDYRMNPALRLKVEKRREREYARSLEFGKRPELRGRR